MDKETQDKFKELEDEIKALKDIINKGKFSNLVVEDTPVQFRFPNLYTAAGGTIAAGTSAGKIAIMINGVEKYIPYFN